jgi:hypothetical protein
MAGKEAPENMEYQVDNREDGLKILAHIMLHHHFKVQQKNNTSENDTEAIIPNETAMRCKNE